VALKDTFCSSPWLHAKIAHNGQLHFCRWSTEKKLKIDPTSNIQNVEPIEFFQKNLSSVRQDILDGKSNKQCQECFQEDQHGKVSGRQRQLLKVGVSVDNFKKTLQSSTIIDELEYSLENQGETNYLPIDWQVDLGNYCNGGCIYCGPEYSSTLASEFKKIGWIDELPDKNWTESPELIDKFVNTLRKTERLAYIHFLGGETVITPAFKKILKALIRNGISKQISIGFTTNLTVWNQEIVDMLTEFKEVNLGMSVECFHPVNDYVRYPSQIESVIETTKRWIKVGNKNNWLMQFRITPSNLTLLHLSSVYDFAYNNQISVESCNFLNEPKHMRVSTLPEAQRKEIIDKLKKWIDGCNFNETQEKIINTRDPSQVKIQIIQDAQSYINYLENEPYETERLPQLVKYLKKLELSRKNSILDYLPEYEQILRTAGY